MSTFEARYPGRCGVDEGLSGRLPHLRCRHHAQGVPTLQPLQVRRQAGARVTTYLRDPKSSTPGHYTVRLVLQSQEVPW